ncbi:MAG: hypothetical protein QXQ02_03125 [Halobacteria archaeon]
MKTVKTKFGSRKFWLALIASALPLINQLLGKPLSEQELIETILTIITYVLAEAGVDIARLRGLK